MTAITTNLQTIQNNITVLAKTYGRDPSTIRLVAVSKRHPDSSIIEAMEVGQNLFGESYIQEAAEKCEHLAKTSAKFHFIGHLQTNKAKIAAGLFTMIESVDRYKLAKALQKHLEKLDKSMDILVQVNIGRDPKKSGVLPEETEALILQIRELSRLRIKGLMTLPPYSADSNKTEKYFRHLKELGNEMQEKRLISIDYPLELSMGMSQDYEIAIKEGATLIRIGTAIFGERPPLHSR